MLSLKKFLTGIVYEQSLEEPGHGSILRYGTTYAITIGWLIPRRGSVFTLLEQICVSGLFVAICTILAYNSCDNRPNSNFCIKLMPPSTSNLTLMTLCSFVVAFFMNTVINRWWNIRLHIQGVIGSSINLMMILMPILASHVRHAHPEMIDTVTQRVKTYAMEISGLLLCSARLLFNKNRREDGMLDLVTKGIISGEDESFYTGDNANSLFPLCTICMRLQDARDEGLLGKESCQADFNLKQLLDHVSTLRANASLATVYITTQLPYPFVQIVVSVVYAFLIQLIFVCSSFISTGIYQERVQKQTATLVGHGYLTIILYSFVLLGMLSLFRQLSNPLGRDASDLPGDTFLADLEKTLTRIQTNAFEQMSHKFTGSSTKVEQANIERINHKAQKQKASSLYAVADAGPKGLQAPTNFVTLEETSLFGTGSFEGSRENHSIEMSQSVHLI